MQLLNSPEIRGCSSFADALRRVFLGVKRANMHYRFPHPREAKMNRHAPADFANSRHRRTLLKLLASGALGAGGLTGMIRAALAAGEHPAVNGLHRAAGEVRVNGVLAGKGTPVKAGDKVTTGKNGQAVFVVGRDAFLLRESGEIALQGEGVLVNTLRVISGKILSVYGKGAHRIATPTATIGIRGSGAYVEAEAARTYICLCYGVADLMDAKDGRVLETVTTTHHESPRYITGGKDGAMTTQAAGVINHTDEELVMLEALQGRLPPFYGETYPK